MDARHWLANESLNAALHSRAFDAARVMDALAGSTAAEQAMKSAASGLTLDHQSIVARATLRSGGYNELSAIAVLPGFAWVKGRMAIDSTPERGGASPCETRSCTGNCWALSRHGR